MAWLAVDKNGTEKIWQLKPIRVTTMWSGFINTDIVPLPSGSIEKLIGRKLTWDDEPVEIT